MSKGPGRVQRIIAALMETEPDGAWTTEDLCRLVYGVRKSKPVTKAHRIAVLRALYNTTTPPLWTVSARRPEHCLYNTGSVESTMAMHKGERSYTMQRAAEDVADALRWHHGSPAERIDIEIEWYRQRIACHFGDPKQHIKNIAELRVRKAELLAAAEPEAA